MELDEQYSGHSNASVTNKIASGELLLSDIPKRSKVWRLFSRIMNREGEEVNFVWCKNCEKVYKYNHAQTSNLLRHPCYIEKFVNADNETSLREEETQTVQLGEVVVNKLTQLLTKWLIESCCSYDLIESEGMHAIFQEILKLGAKLGSDVCLSKLLPSVSEISANISDAFNYCFEAVKRDLASVKEDGFGLTADIWTDSLTKEDYIALTVHYCKNSALTYRLLGFQLLEDDWIKTKNITDTAKSILEKFDCQLSNKCIIVTNEVGYSINTLPDSQNLTCISQLLSNAVLKSMEKLPKVSEIINACSKLVNFLQKMAPNTITCKLPHKSHHNRCLSIYKTLNSILINWNEIEQLLQSEKEAENFAININILKAIENVFQPFAEAIETLEDDSHATLHLVMAYMHELRKFCQTNSDEYKGFKFVKQLQENMYLNLDEMVMQNIRTLHKIAVFLYPPTKKLLPYSDDEKQSIEDECIRLLKHYKIETKPLIKQEPDEQPLVALVCKRRKLLADFLESETIYDTNEIIRQEIQNYKNTRVVFSAGFNVFNWWELQKDNFPYLYKLSSTVLATPATSAASKRIFSNAKCLVSDKQRHNSTETDVESIMFINANASGVQLDQYFTT